MHYYQDLVVYVQDGAIVSLKVEVFIYKEIWQIHGAIEKHWIWQSKDENFNSQIFKDLYEEISVNKKTITVVFKPLSKDF